MDELVALVVANLPNYKYPAFRIQIYQKKDDLDFGGGVYGRFAPTQDRTDRELDEYHRMLLWHDSKHKNLAGLSSVVYWGYARFGDRYARGRVAWLMNGFRNRPAVTPLAAGQCLTAARSFVTRGRYGEALGSIGTLSQLGRTPFASKVIAFLDPDHAGVYDNKIGDGLVNRSILKEHTVAAGRFEHCTGGVGPVASPTIQRKYQAWCEALSAIARCIGDVSRNCTHVRWTSSELFSPQLTGPSRGRVCEGADATGRGGVP